jgi:hypothetical protein
MAKLDLQIVQLLFVIVPLQLLFLVGLLVHFSFLPVSLSACGSIISSIVPLCSRVFSGKESKVTGLPKRDGELLELRAGKTDGPQ